MIKHKILLPDGTTLTSGTGTINSIRSVQLTEQVNAETDLCPGAACAASAQIELWAPENGLAITQGDSLTLFRTDSATGQEEPVGIFLAEKPVKSSANVYKITAYDRMILLDKDLFTWLRDQQSAFPMTLASFITAVCGQCGVTLAADALTGLPNASYQIQAFYADSLTGRQLIQWAAQAAGRFARMTPAGELTFGWFTAQGLTLTPQQYLQGSLQYEDYETAAIDKVQIRQSDSDVGVIYPSDATGDNALVIQGNLLLTAENAEQIRPIAQSLYTLLQGIRYTPLSVSLYVGAAVPAPGTIVTVLDAHNRQLTTCVMQRSISGQKVSLTSTGNPRRDSTAAVNRSRLENLNGKMLEIQADIGQLSIKASELSGDFSELQQSVDSISLGVTSQKQYEDILSSAAWTEPYGSASISDGVLTVSGQSDKESGASVYVPSQNLAALAGKYIRVSLEYKVTQQYSGGFFRVTLWYVYETESGGGRYVNIIDPGETVAPMNDWKTFSFLYLAKDDVVTKLQLNPRAQSGASGTVEIRNVTIAAEVGVQNTVSILKDGIEISSATLDTQPTLKDFTALKLDQSKLSLTVVKDGEVRSKFAADDSSVTIQSGVITFASNTLVVDSENFQLKQDGTVQITGTFTSLSGIDKAYIGSGQLHLERQTNDGVWRPTLYSYSEGQNAALGHLLMYGPGSAGNQIPMASLASSFTGGEFWLYYENSKPMFQITQHTNGGPYFSLNDTSWNAIGKWLMDDDGRGHLTTPIVELEKLKAYGETHTAQWVYISSIGRRVLCALD